jgi:site-specific DNA recombinase
VNEDVAIIYVRVSTQSQEDGTSIAAQASACYETAKSKNLRVVEYIEEVMSGGLYMARTGLQKALELIEDGTAKNLIIYRVDRSGRDLDGLRDIKRRIEFAGGALIYADGLTFDKNAFGNYMFTQFGAVAELEREMIRDRTMKGLRATAAKGVQPARSFSPWGYYIVKKKDILRGEYSENEEGKYIVIPEQAEQVSNIFEKYIELRTLRGVTAWLFHQGIPSPTGNTHWKPCTINQILKNQVYKGVGIYGKYRHRTDERRLSDNLKIPFKTPAPREEWVTFDVPPIVTAEVWESANKTRQIGNSTRSGRSRYMLTGLVYCPVCNSRMYAIRIRDTKYSGRLCGYGCSKVYPFDAPGGARSDLKCERKKYNSGVLERMLMEGLDYIFSQPEIIQTAIDKYAKLQKAKPRPKSAQAEITSLKSTIEKSSKMEITAARSVITAQISGSDGAAYEAIRKESETKRLQAEMRLAELQKKNQKAKPLEIKIEAWQIFKSTFSSDTISEADKGQILKEFIEAIYPVPHPSRKPYVTGGLEVILKTNSPEKLVMRNVVGEKITLKIRERNT